MAKRVFIWVAHPKAGSLNAALAERYAAGARGEGAEVRIMHLSDMAPEAGYSDGQDLSPDIQTWQDNIRWADHVMILHP
ncbi:MAG: NAD(P)H-dependent oxidoreductase, partial [Ruegeria sp.]